MDGGCVAETVDITGNLDYEPRENVLVKGVTYSEIKDRILDQYGLKASSLCVTQVKDKCGIKDFEAYNHGKGDQFGPNCPLEIEKAILSILTWFSRLRDYQNGSPLNCV